MSVADYLYLIKTVEDNKLQLVTKVDIVDGVTMSEGRICAVLKRYTPPVDMVEALSDIQKFSATVPSVVKQIGKKTSGKIYTDHIGNEFETVFQLCAYYKISESKYRSRLTNGWTQEEALTGVRKKKQATDHLGNVFDSKTEMCQFYGVRETLFNARINAGKTLEEALLGIDEDSETMVEDHLGNKYKNVSQMCKAYGVRLDVYCQRKKRGWTLEDVLTGRKKSEPVTDHKGNTYSDLEEMCLEYGVQKPTYLHRIGKGWTVEEALTGLKKDSVVYDHLGNMYLTQKEMCESYGLKLGTFLARMRRGLTLEAALTTDLGEPRKSNGKTVSDHLGNTYPTIMAMCEAYSVKTSTYQCRVRNGYTTEEALTGVRKTITPPQEKKKPLPKKPKEEKQSKPEKKSKNMVADHLGNEYSSTLEMCKAYGIRVDTFRYRMKHGSTLEQALTRTPSMVTTNIPCQDHLGNQYISQTEMARAYGLTKEQYIARKRIGWDVERILTTPVGGGNGKTFEFNGVTYLSKKDFCEKNGLNYDVFIHRTNSGMTIEEALTAGTDSKPRSTMGAIDHNGTQYATIKEMCEHYGVSVATYKYRRDHGWDIKQALLGIRPK